jgi:hypothetical protein
VHGGLRFLERRSEATAAAATARLRTEDFVSYNIDPSGAGDGSPTVFKYSNGRDGEPWPAGGKQWCRRLEQAGIAFQ